MSRRYDNQLRAAISVIEGMLLANASKDTILDKCLSELMQLLGSTYGYIYQCQTPMGDTIPWELSCTKQSINGKLHDVENASCSHRVPPAFIEKFLAGQCVFSNHSEASFEPIPQNNPGIINYFCLPLVDSRKLHAVIYLCNTKNGFGAEVGKRLLPFTAAANCLLRNAERRSGTAPLTEALSNAVASQSQSALEAVFNAILFVENDKITECNQAASAMLGLPRREIVDRNLNDFIPCGSTYLDARRQNDSSDADFNQLSTAVSRGVPVVKANGKRILVDLRMFDQSDNNQRAYGIVMDDISERMQSISDYHDTLQRFQVLTNLAPVGIIQLDKEGECTYTNDTWSNFANMSPEQALGSGWLDSVHPEDREQFQTELAEQIAQSGRYEGQFRLLSKNDESLWVQATSSSLYDGSGHTNGMIMILNDVSEHLNQQQYLKSIAETDGLTKLANRARFTQRLDEACEECRFGPVVLMFLDLDKFKQVNDTYGHDVGDLLLQQVAKRLRLAARNADTIARLGGDEFTVLITDVTRSRTIAETADAIIDALNKPFELGQHSLNVTTSIGIAVTNTANIDGKTLLKQSDVALYRAKASGRNQYKFFTHELDQDRGLHQIISKSLNERADQDFRLVFLPQVDARTGKPVAIEALTRWSHQGYNKVCPNNIVSMIEELGLLAEFTDWQINALFRLAARWQKLGSNIPISLNISTRQLHEPNFTFSVTQLCKDYAIKPENVTFEITEDAITANSDAAINTLEQLKDLGFHLCLDDFGTGYASLALLRELPIDKVKIDGSFVKQAKGSEKDAKILSATINFAELLELEVIAEGVEDEQTCAWLVEHNCYLQQGFHFYQPIERKETESLLDLGRSKTSKLLSFLNS